MYYQKYGLPGVPSVQDRIIRPVSIKDRLGSLPSDGSPFETTKGSPFEKDTSPFEAVKSSPFEVDMKSRLGPAIYLQTAGGPMRTTRSRSRRDNDTNPLARSSPNKEEQ